MCRQGHSRDKNLPLEMEVREQGRYTITKLEDVSVLRAKRYKAVLLLDKHYPKDVIRELIQKATKELKHQNYYQSDKIKEWWGTTPAHVIWIYVACDNEDIQHINWLCRTCWIDPDLPEDKRPSSCIQTNERFGDIEIDWNDDYKAYKEVFADSIGTKEEVLTTIQSDLKQMSAFVEKMINTFEVYQQGSLSEKQFLSSMQRLKPTVTECFLQSGDTLSPPLDCADYYDACLALFSTIHDMFLFCSDDRSTQNRDWLIADTIQRFHEDLTTVEFEERKIH